MKVGAVMPKDNKDSVRDYHKKLTDIKVRFPSKDDELGIPDYKELIGERAKARKQSVNAYILSLIEKDLGITIKKGFRDNKE